MATVRDGERYVAWEGKATPERARHARESLYEASNPHPEFSGDAGTYRKAMTEWWAGRDKYLQGHPESDTA